MSTDAALPDESTLPDDPETLKGMIRELLLERAAVDRGEDVERAVVGVCAPNPERCAEDCCPNMRLALSAVP